MEARKTMAKTEMVRVRMLTSAAGPSEILRIDKEYDRPKAEAERFEARGICEILGPAKEAVK